MQNEREQKVCDGENGNYSDGNEKCVVSKLKAENTPVIWNDI